MKIRTVATLLFAFAPLFAQDHLKFGQPACSGPVLDKKFFIVCHDATRKIPVWVGYSLSKDDLASANAKRKGLDFRADPDLAKGQRAEIADYKNTATVKYDKGHMAPAADFERSAEAIKATFVLSNAVPQKHGVNAGVWARLEAAVRALADSHGHVWVFSGPVFVGNKAVAMIGPDKVAVPTHTYKVILCVNANGDHEMFAFVMPNINKPSGKMEDYGASVSNVQKLTGLDFFSALPAAEQERLEASVRNLPVE